MIAAHRPHPLRLLVAAAATLLATFAVAAPASATPVAPSGPATGHPAGFGAGYSDVINIDADPDLEAAVQFLQKIEDGDTVPTYCINAPVPYDDDAATTYTSETWAAGGAANMAKAANLAVSSSSIGTPLTDANAEAAAVQLAIWKLTDNVDFSVVANATIVARANALVAGATDATEKASAFTVDITAAKISATQVVLTVSFRTNTGTEQANQSVDVAFPGGSQTVATDANGNATLTIDAPATAGTASATWSGVLPAGSVLAPAGTTQKVVTVVDATIERSATTDVPAADGTPTSIPPSTSQPTPTASTPTGGTPTELPYTGTWVTPAMLAAAVAVAGGALYVMRRARRA